MIPPIFLGPPEPHGHFCHRRYRYYWHYYSYPGGIYTEESGSGFTQFDAAAAWEDCSQCEGLPEYPCHMPIEWTPFSEMQETTTRGPFVIHKWNKVSDAILTRILEEEYRR